MCATIAGFPDPPTGAASACDGSTAGHPGREPLGDEQRDAAADERGVATPNRATVPRALRHRMRLDGTLPSVHRLDVSRRRTSRNTRAPAVQSLFEPPRWPWLEPLGAQPARRHGAQAEEQIGQRSRPQPTHCAPRETGLNSRQHGPGVHQRFVARPQHHLAHMASGNRYRSADAATQPLANDPIDRRGAL